MAWCASLEKQASGLRMVAGLALCAGAAWGAVKSGMPAACAGQESEEGWRALAERWPTVKASMTAPVENLLLPLDHFPNGMVKAQLAAKKAQVFLDGLIFAEDVTVKLFNDRGQPDGFLTAEGCIFDRNTKNGYCDGPVSMEKDGDRLKGRGMYFSFERQSIKILSECEIRTRRIRNNFGRLK